MGLETTMTRALKDGLQPGSEGRTMNNACGLMELTEQDVISAMCSMQGYVDITPGTFREIYVLAYDLAVKRLRSLGTAGEVMTSPVHCLKRDMSVSEAAAFMARFGISGAPVVDEDGVICGVVSEKDFLRTMGLPDTAGFMAVIGECLSHTRCLVADLRKL
jgi:CBS-domain-containing membrane protein